MRTLRKGHKGRDVEALQRFMRGEGLYHLLLDGDFGDGTEKAVLMYQRVRGLRRDGVVGPDTYASMIGRGLVIAPEVQGGESDFPVRAGNPLGTARSARLFGPYEWTHAPTSRNREAIQIKGTWEQDNIRLIQVPQLVRARVSQTGRARVHRLVAQQFLDLWAAWEKADLLHHVVSWDGAFVARTIRGSHTVLSNHAFGSAFDINQAQNPMGHRGARPGQEGCVWELVPSAVEHGFYWGGWFRNPDLMHFEVNRLL